MRDQWTGNALSIQETIQENCRFEERHSKFIYNEGFHCVVGGEAAQLAASTSPEIQVEGEGGGGQHRINRPKLPQCLLCIVVLLAPVDYTGVAKVHPYHGVPYGAPIAPIRCMRSIVSSHHAYPGT